MSRQSLRLPPSTIQRRSTCNARHGQRSRWSLCKHQRPPPANERGRACVQAMQHPAKITGGMGKQNPSVAPRTLFFPRPLGSIAFRGTDPPSGEKEDAIPNMAAPAHSACASVTGHSSIRSSPTFASFPLTAPNPPIFTSSSRGRMRWAGTPRARLAGSSRLIGLQTGVKDAPRATGGRRLPSVFGGGPGHRRRQTWKKSGVLSPRATPASLSDGGGDPLGVQIVTPREHVLPPPPLSWGDARGTSWSGPCLAPRANGLGPA
jgi:hypothetical protein